MSRHHKKLTLGALNDTWDEIGKQIRQMENRVEQARNDAIETATRNAKAEIERTKEEANRRLKHEISALERRTNSRLADLDRRHSENLQRATSQIYDDMNRGFNVLDSRINVVKQQIDVVQEDIHNIFDYFENEATMARDVADEMKQLLQVVCENNPITAYAPNDLDDIQNHINNLLTSNYPPASIIAISDGIVRDILKMKEKTLLEKAKHDEMIFQTRARLAAILEVIGNNLDQPIEHEEESSTIATDFWTNGDYINVLEKLKAIDEQLANEDEDNPLSVEQISDLLQKAENLNKDGIALMRQAVQKAIQSLDRADITLDIVNAMIRQGYEIKIEDGDDAYDYIGGCEERDQREGMFAILRHPNTGEEITIVLQPNSDNRTNSIDIHVDNPNQAITEQQLRQSVERVRQEMLQSGYDPGQIEVPADGGNDVIPQMQSGQQMRKKGAANQLRQYH